MATRRATASRRSSSVGAASITSGSAGPPRPIATTTTSRSRASRRARWPVTAVFPTRLPVPITASDGSANGSNAGGSKRKSAPTYGTPAASALDASAKPLARAEHRLVGQVDDDVRPVLGDRLLEAGDQRHAVVLAAAELLGAAGEHGGDELVGQLGERVADDRRVVLPVDHGDRPAQLRDESSPSIRAVYFSNSSVSVENWMIRSWPWNG